MKDKETKENKGFAFVNFTAKEAAQRAIEELHDKEHKVLPCSSVGRHRGGFVLSRMMCLHWMVWSLVQGRTLRCSLSQAKHRLFVGNVPKGLGEEELRKIIQGKGPGVVNIEMFKVCLLISQLYFVRQRSQVC